MILKDFAWLLFFHLLADYPLQGEYLAITKGKNWLSLVSHAAIWTGTICLGLIFLGYHWEWPVVVFLFAGHLVDWFKATNHFPFNKLSLNEGLLVDQLWHVLQVIIVLIRVNMY